LESWIFGRRDRPDRYILGNLIYNHGIREYFAAKDHKERMNSHRPGPPPTRQFKK
jgi:hypothetical protein